MFSSDTLSQLTALKQEIRARKDIAQGVVRGTAGRYGFVRLDDNRDVYLNPEQMAKVLPGDKVEVDVTTNDKEQLEGTLEKLIHSPLKHIAGRYCIKGKGHFVVYENQLYTRWIFVPPKARAGAKDQQYVTAKISQHPFTQAGKAQAKITHTLGEVLNASDIRYLAITQHQLFEHFPKDALAQAQSLHSAAIETEDSRPDLQSLDFITIDAPSTQDMDDAITVETTDNGWQLWVAIADPGSEIALNSPLDRSAAQRMQTLYFPGKALPMLPEMLSTSRYSLLAHQVRRALVCKLDITAQGEITHYEFIPARIRSAAKLSYRQASDLITQGHCQDNDKAQLNDHAPQLQQLHQCAQALRQQRKATELVLSNRPNFELILNSEGKVATIEKTEHTEAHNLVEEAMIATNKSAGDYLAQHRAGLFSTQPGYKTERRADIEQLLKEALGEQKVTDTANLSNYISIIKHLQGADKHQLLLSKQQRFQEGSRLSTEPSPHFGLGVTHYATVTSPIRRYQDLYNQRLIHQLLQGDNSPLAAPQHATATMQETLSNNRNALRYMHQWLMADYMADKIGQTFSAHIALLTTQGVGVRLVDTGIEGFIARKKEDKKNPQAPYDKISFNHQRLELQWNKTELTLEQQVEVTLTAIDPVTQKLAFSWVNAL